MNEPELGNISSLSHLIKDRPFKRIISLLRINLKTRVTILPLRYAASSQRSVFSCPNVQQIYSRRQCQIDGPYNIQVFVGETIGVSRASRCVNGKLRPARRCVGGIRGKVGCAREMRRLRYRKDELSGKQGRKEGRKARAQAGELYEVRAGARDFLHYTVSKLAGTLLAGVSDGPVRQTRLGYTGPSATWTYLRNRFARLSPSAARGATMIAIVVGVALCATAEIPLRLFASSVRSFFLGRILSSLQISRTAAALLLSRLQQPPPQINRREFTRISSHLTPSRAR